MKQLESSDPFFKFAKPNSCPPRGKTGTSLEKVVEGGEIYITAEAGLWCRKQGDSVKACILNVEPQPSVSVWLPKHWWPTETEQSDQEEAFKNTDGEHSPRGLITSLHSEGPRGQSFLGLALFCVSSQPRTTSRPWPLRRQRSGRWMRVEEETAKK